MNTEKYQSIGCWWYSGSNLLKMKYDFFSLILNLLKGIMANQLLCHKSLSERASCVSVHECMFWVIVPVHIVAISLPGTVNP